MILLKIWNDGSGTEEVGNYEWCAYVNEELIEDGVYEGHRRSEGWRSLVKKIMEKN